MDPRISADFPIDWDEDDYVSRREFVKFLTLASGGMAIATTGLAAWSQVPRERRSFERKLIGRIEDIPVGGWQQFTYPRDVDACILVRTGPRTVVAFSRRCTHLSCPVTWQPEEKRLYCPCHNGAFSILDGHVLQGPPARPLPRIELAMRGGDIFATGVREQEI